jgi:4-diphosphocytidyl-2-C-methyl-D-erythritol kinase
VPSDPSRVVRVRVPAKVNLHLSVGPVRPDGFHDLVTVFHAVDLMDEVTAAPAQRLALTVTGEGTADLPTDAGNLAWRAAALLAETAGIRAAVRIGLHKTIPVAGGMAGGSADAAGTLLACATLWGLDDADLAGLAARLGSDTVFPLMGGTAVGTGRGEVLAPVPVHPPLHWVLALAHGGISAGDAYRELDRQRAAGSAAAPAGSPDALLVALATGDPAALAPVLINDLQPAALALRPALRATIDAGVRLGALAGMVSGSGPTCAFLCRSEGHAAELAAELALAGIGRATRVASGPAPGARVVG